MLHRVRRVIEQMDDVTPEIFQVLDNLEGAHARLGLPDRDAGSSVLTELYVGLIRVRLAVLGENDQQLH